MAIGDADLGSLVRQITDDLHMPAIGDIVRRKALQVMRYHRDRRYFFSDRELRFNLTVGRTSYRPGDGFGLPADLVEIAGPVIWILMDGSEDNKERCVRTSTANFEEARAAWSNQTSQPEEWDWRNGALRLAPAPSSADDVLELRYISNLSVPKVSYDGSTNTYRYWHPDTNVELTTAQVDTWSNDWLTQEGAEAAIRARTTYELQKTYLKDEEGAASSLGLWLEMIAQLENETESKTGALGWLEGSFL
jgi:hypothetical protein